MLRNIIGRFSGGRRRPTAGGTTRSTGRPATGGSPNRDLEQGAKSVARGLARKRRR